MNDALTAAIDKIRSVGSLAITCHINPDGDAPLDVLGGAAKEGDGHVHRFGLEGGEGLLAHLDGGPGAAAEDHEHQDVRDDGIAGEPGDDGVACCGRIGHGGVGVNLWLRREESW